MRARRANALTTIAILIATVATGCGNSSTPSAQQTATVRRPTDTQKADPKLGDSNPHAKATDLTTVGPDGQPQGDASAGSDPTSVPAPAARAATVKRPPIIRQYIPFPARRKQEMAAYARRHYGLNSYKLRDPQVIVEHYTVTDTVQATYNTFAPDVPDVELHELPQVCSHFVIGTDGSIHQLVPIGLMCRHTVGLNYTALGIEHVGNSDQDILGNARQLRASLRLTTWLRCRFAIKVSNVIGHNESRSSPFHHENVARLDSQTHADWTHADMEIYRRKLRRQHCA